MVSTSGMEEQSLLPIHIHSKLGGSISDPLQEPLSTMGRKQTETNSNTILEDGPLSLDALRHLKEYKYQAVDKSLISNHILRHYWNWSVNLLPLWMAPNLVTLLGFFAILINVILLEIYMPGLDGNGPQWIYFSFAAGLWFYSTMDNVDGKQARRTGSSSPLGELFDHGIDSLNCTLASLGTVACMGFGSSKMGVFTALIPILPMWFSTWETFHSHVLYLGYFNGPTEGLIIACSLLIASGIYGPQIWTYKIADYIGFNETFGDMSIQDAWFPLIFGTFVFLHLPFCVKNVIDARRKANLPVAPVFYEWTPIVVFCAAGLGWIYSPHTHLRSDNHLVLFCLTLAFVFGRMTTKIILAHLTRQPFPWWTMTIMPLVGGAVLANLPVFGFPQIPPALELAYLRGYLLFAIVVYFRWALLTINSICGYLGIKCLTIPYDKQQPAAKTPPKENAASAANGELKQS